MNTSRSEFLRLRGLRYHLRRWGDPSAPLLLLLHGFLDVSASFQYLVEGLLPQLQVIAPDWRGFGHTQWPQDGYWFQDYVADLEAIVDHYSPQAPVLLAGHSMGTQAASLFAGLRPQRVQKLVLLDGPHLPDMPAPLVCKRFGSWLHQQGNDRAIKPYDSFETLAGRIRKSHPALSERRALFVAHCWAREDARGRITLCADPKHYRDSPGLHRLAESEAIWREVTAPTLFIDAEHSAFGKPGDSARQRTLQCFANHRQTLIDAGHMLHFDAPEATAALMREFLLA